MRIQIVVMGMAILSAVGLGQSTATPTGPVFEIADVHGSPKSINTAKQGPTFRNGRYEVLRTTMLDLISAAYNIDVGKVIGGPNWVDSERFDIIAKAPADTKPDALKLMLQALLAERFQLTAHIDNRPQARYELTVGKGKLQLNPSSGAAGACRFGPQTQTGTLVIVTIACQSVTMERLAATLTSLSSTNFYLEGPVVDSTELRGTWDVDIKMTPPAVRKATGEGDSIFEAMEKLGLKLERRDMPMPFLVLDRVSEHPTPNPPGAQQALAPPKDPEFEVASIKPVAVRSDIPGALTISPSGLVTLRNRTLRNWIMIAWNISEDAIIGLPKFATTELFDLTAEAPANTTRPGDIDTIRPLLRTLLADRFGLAVHLSEQPSDVYVLSAPKSEVKMKRGNDAERGSCKSTPEALRANPDFTVAFTCTNTTMPQFTDRVRSMAFPPINHSVVNETGLEGAWDFVVMWKWTAPSAVNGRINPDQPGDRTDALPQPGGLTFFEAINKQLGLKLTLQKRPMPVLVIDHLESKPTEN